MSSGRKGGGGGGGIGQGFDRSLWPGVGHLNYLTVPGVGIFEFLFVPVTTNHFTGWGISVIFDLTFLPPGRELDSNFLENVKSTPYALPTPCRLDIDRCMKYHFIRSWFFLPLLLSCLDGQRKGKQLFGW